MNELLKMLLEMMEEAVPTSEKEDTSKSTEEEGEFKSLVPETEVKHWEEVCNQCRTYIKEVHIPDVMKKLDMKDLTAKQRVHYMVYLVLISDLTRDLGALATINTKGVEAIDRAHSEGMSYHRMERNLFLNSMMGGVNKK